MKRAEAYEFFCGADGAGRPEWSPEFRRRRSVFRNPGRCFRPGAVYNPGLGRYLLCLMTRAGYLGIFDAPEPWGPWTLAYVTEEFGPPETRFQPRIPAKWISPDGRAFHLVYSCHPCGPYCFNVQRCRVE